MWSYATSQTRSGRSGSQLRSFPRVHRLVAPGRRCPFALASSRATAQSRHGWSSIASARSRQLDDELLAHRGRERRGNPDMVERVVVVVQAEQERADHRAGALLVPAEAGDHAISRALVLHLDHRALPGAIGRVETLCHDTIEPGALEAAEPVRRKRSIARSR